MLLLLSHFSRVRLCATPETAAHQAPQSLGFSRLEHWSGLPFPSPMHESEKWKWSRSVMYDPQQPHGLQPSRLLRPWDFPGKSTGVGCHCLLKSIPKASFGNLQVAPVKAACTTSFLEGSGWKFHKDWYGSGCSPFINAHVGSRPIGTNPVPGWADWSIKQLWRIKQDTFLFIYFFDSCWYMAKHFFKTDFLFT